MGNTARDTKHAVVEKREELKERVREFTFWDRIVNTRLEKIKTILGAKASEYASSSDRFHNFNIAGRIAGITPEKALYGMMLKHEVSVLDLIEIAGAEPEKLDESLIDEKIGDYINYLILLEGLLKQRCPAKESRLLPF